MDKLTLELPAMYGDHHVLEVRRILLEMPGVAEVYASSCFHVVEVTYDPARLDADTIRAALEAAGYTEPLAIPVETGQAAYGRDGDTFFRHTTAFTQIDQTVSFAQRVSYAGRPLWPCPGMGVVKAMNGDE